MPTTRPFAYNSGTTISGTEQIGEIAVGVSSSLNYSENAGGVRWWNGPDEDLGYVIAHTTLSGNQPNPDGVPSYIGFWRSLTKTENDFITLTNSLFGTFYTTGDQCKTYLNNNGYWTSYSTIEPVTNNLVLYYDPSNLLSYPNSGTTINDLSGNGRNGTMSNISFTSPYFTYNGSSSSVSIADNALLEPGSGSWTMEVWVNQSVSGGDVVLGKFDNGGLAIDVSYSIRTTGTAYYAQIGSGSGSGSNLYVNSTSYTGLLNTWYQIVYVFKNGGTKTLETFVNGVSIGSVNHSLSSILNSTNPLYLGSYNGGEYSQWFDGKIGITRLYNTSLTSTQVLQNFNADKSKYGL